VSLPQGNFLNLRWKRKKSGEAERIQLLGRGRKGKTEGYAAKTRDHEIVEREGEGSDGGLAFLTAIDPAA